MIRKISIVVFALCSALTAYGAQAGQNSELLGRAKSLLEHGRYADARHEYMRLKSVTPPSNVGAMQQVEFGLTVCAAKLDDNVAEQRMLDFITRYPGSVHAADVRFLLALHYCETEEWAKAKAEFEKVHYKSLTRADRERYDVRMGYIEFIEGNYEQSVSYFDRITNRGTAYEHALYYKSYISYMGGDINKAYDGFSALKSSEIYSDLIPYYLVQLEFDRGNYKYVVDNCDKLLESSSGGERSAVMRLAAEAHAFKQEQRQGKGRNGEEYGQYRYGRTYRQQDPTDTACRVCQGLICADCCCECMGGDLISCC